uniref:Prolyl 4-hydroxylase alpha subunit domain-containing protein n=1 Tax=Noctiluca scintillans TaxID=2966 RepID=A0A7S1FJ60_NOCSC|mmetsp:Transcript_65730/g.174204  ORF Transcript_65730/g.174204 Transcript_65730/m.174204 type:complete len:441 (+) Transcript_65730:30-1352(+)
MERVIHPTKLGEIAGSAEPASTPDSRKTFRACVVRKDPKITVVPNFLGQSECQHLMDLAWGNFVPSLISKSADGSPENYAEDKLSTVSSPTRTSSSCMLRYAQTAVVERIEQRLATMARLPLSNLERLSLVRYRQGEYFDEHHDGKFRPRTVLMYLNDFTTGEDGGTSFPKLHLRFKSACGAAIMWSNVTADGREDRRVLHKGLPPWQGVKYVLNAFFNNKVMRHMERPAALQQWAQVDLSTLVSTSDGTAGRQSSDTLQVFVLSSMLKMLAVPGFATVAEVAVLLSGGTDVEEVLEASPRSSSTVHVFQFEENSTVKSLESRIAAVGAQTLNHLAQLRLVRLNSVLGFCDRGCGPKSAYLCLEDEGHIAFPLAGLRVTMNRGDLLLWNNVDWDSGVAVELMQTLRFHSSTGSDSLGLDVCFSDTPIRSLQIGACAETLK